MLTDCFLCFPLGLVFVFLLHVCLFFSFGCCCWCLDFLRSISSLTDLRPVSDNIDLKKSRHHKNSSEHQKKDTGKEHKHKN